MLNSEQFSEHKAPESGWKVGASLEKLPEGTGEMHSYSGEVDGLPFEDSHRNLPGRNGCMKCRHFDRLAQAEW